MVKKAFRAAFKKEFHWIRMILLGICMLFFTWLMGDGNLKAMRQWDLTNVTTFFNKVTDAQPSEDFDFSIAFSAKQLNDAN